MMRRQLMDCSRTWCGAVLLALFLTGCGGSRQIPPEQSTAAQSAFDDALEALKARDFPTAVENFTAAIEEQALGADQYAEALLRRAECHVELGNLEDATADLELVADRVPDLDQFHLVRCKLYAKQGDAAKAQAEFEEARRFNPNVQRPALLN